MILEYKDIDIYQGEYRILRNINLNIGYGEMVYLVGAVGSGKTSLMKTIYGEVECSGDKACALGQDLLSIKPQELPELRRRMGIVFQDFQLLPDRSVRKNLDFVLRATDWTEPEEREERIMEVLKMVNLTKHVDTLVYKLSGGEQQRICIARAVLNNPLLILADEPTGNLDTDNGEMIMALLDEIRRQNNTSIIVSTHNLQWLEYFPGTVYRCKDGILQKEDAETQEV